jgi:hypothetical protein
MFYDIELGCHYEVGSCSDARKYTGSNTLCTDCPFGDCINYLKPAEKSLIMRAGTIRKAYDEYDRAGNINAVAALLGLDYNRIYAWLRERDKIEQKLCRYAPA